MKLINLCFEVHQPLRLRRRFQNSDGDALLQSYFDMDMNRRILEKVAGKCYFPANELLLKLMDYYGKKFKFSFSMTGVFLDQLRFFDKKLLESFKQLASTGRVEFLGQTYYHSLASLYGIDRSEFIEQVKLHRKAMLEFFDYKTKVFENTEFIYNNLIAKTVEGLGFKGIFTEGIERVLGWRSPNYLYTPPKHLCNRIKILLRNYRLSDDIGYRFSARWWEEWPLTADKYAAWLSACEGECINIFIDYETFGEHQWEDSGIFWFLGRLPHEVLKYDNLRFSTPSEACEKLKPVGEIDVFEYSTISWADIERDTSAWLGNEMQLFAYEEVKKLEPVVKKLGDPEILRIWRYLQNSDHLYYMCTKWWGDGDVHTYFSCYDSAQEGFINFLKVLSDLKYRIWERMRSKG
jgi:alpha-amylase